MPVLECNTISWIFCQVWVGLSISPTHLPNSLVPDPLQPDPTASWSNVGPNLQNLTSTVRFRVPTFKNRSTRPAQRENNLLWIQAFWQVFQHDLADFDDQNTRSSDSRHDLGEKALDLVKSLPDSARSHLILDGSGEISPIFSFFHGFQRVSTSPETDAHPMGNRGNPIV